ncbi:hypothetical protein M5689_015587 [Euphorbia peplus]|nr:hypothetical protein M5689_015587 [Euphorbia peplus]
MDSVSRHRLLSIFPSSDVVSSATGTAVDDDLTEDDVLWTIDAVEQSTISSPADKNTDAATTNHRRTSSFNKNSGILAALPESNNHSVLLSRKSSIPSSSKAIPLVPRTERDYAPLSQSLPATARKMNQSAPVNVPLLSIAMAQRRSSRFVEPDDEIDDGEEEAEEKLPPHELVARGSRNSPWNTFSVLEGVGRTLKGRDLRQVRSLINYCVRMFGR